jgi:xanthine dehydrogenase YagS FAD-binding subunit
MRPFAYERPHDVAGALAAAGADASQARYLAGGTNLVDLMKLGVERPARLVDVSRLPMDVIEDLPDGGLRIGANVRNSDLAVSAVARERYPLLSQALLSGASGQLRNRATIAGNLLQRTRCAYFQDVSKPCNKRVPGSGCPAREGDHRNLAILGHSPSCVATHPSDMAVAMAAIGGEVHVLGPRGTRTIPLGGLHRLPGDEPERDTVLAPGDLITAVELSPLRFAGCSRYRKVRDRASFSFAVTSLAAALDVRDGTVRDCRIAFGGLAPVPWRALRAEELLRGEPATQESFERGADAELAQAQPLRDNAFKVTLARNLLVRTLCELCEAA